MNNIHIFAIRLILSIAIAAVLIRVFGLAFDPLNVALLAAIMMGLVYLKEYFRKRKESRKGETRH